MSDNPILGFSVMNRLAARVTPPGHANIVQKHYFSRSRNRGCRLYTARRQTLEFWALGATNFSNLRNFYKTAFPDSLTV